MAESSLKIESAPGSLASFAAAHNALVDLIKTARGTGGVKVFASDGRILIDGSGVSVTAGDSPSTTASTLYYNNGTVEITIGAVGISMTMLWSGDNILFDASTGAFEMFDVSSGNSLVINPADMFYGNYAMREFTVCNSGSPENRRFLASEPY